MARPSEELINCQSCRQPCRTSTLRRAICHRLEERGKTLRAVRLVKFGPRPQTVTRARRPRCALRGEMSRVRRKSGEIDLPGWRK